MQARAQQQEWPSPEVEQLYNQGMEYMGRGSMTEAIAVFQKTLQVAPDNFMVRRSLARAYQLAGENKQVASVLDPLFSNGKADAECYRIAAIAYSGNKDEGKARKTLQTGIEKFPASGVLYHELGLLYEQQEDEEKALKTWLDGIHADANYHLNYYEAALAYMNTDNAIWPILYGEIFINKEPNTRRAAETRSMLLEAYKKLFFTPAKNADGKTGNAANPQNFEEAVRQTFMNLFFVVSDGITTENLTMLRSRFIVNWAGSYASQYPFSLFSFQEDLMRNGNFDAYNQWLLGKAENPQQYNVWAGSFAADVTALETRLARQPLSMAARDDYNRQRNFKNQFKKKTAAPNVK
jgi:hypothetical protein